MKNPITVLFFLLTGLTMTSQSVNEIGFYLNNGCSAVASKENLMLVSQGDVVDISNPSSPALIGQYSGPGYASSIIIDGDNAYFGTGMTQSLYIADISNPTFPLHNSSTSFSIGNGIFGMDKLENTLFIALGQNGAICSIDISDNTEPIVLDTLYIPGGQCRDVVVHDNYIYAAHADGLKVVDITDPSDLQLVTTIGTGYNSIVFGDDLVFAGKSSPGGVDVYNVSDPMSPVPAYSLVNSGGTAWDLKYNDGLLYLAGNTSGLTIYEIESDEGEEVANYPNTGNGQTFGVALQDSLILLTGLLNGVTILEYDSSGFVGLSSEIIESQVDIYPNPAMEAIQVDAGDAYIERLEILDSKGNIMQLLDCYETNSQIDISEIPCGLYSIRIKTDDRVFNRTLIKQ